MKRGGGPRVFAQNWPYKDMLCVRRRWSDAGPPGGQGLVLSSTMPRAQNRAAKRFNSIMRIFHFAHLGILFIFGLESLALDQQTRVQISVQNIPKLY